MKMSFQHPDLYVRMLNELSLGAQMGVNMAYSDELWKEAKRKCRLNTEDLELAKRLGLNPRSLIKNIPNKSEPWKASVKEWIHDIDAKRQKKQAHGEKHF